jgi:Uma2 family endonuclease
MTQEEFHRVYEKMRDDVKAEPIEGILYVASPLGLPHGRTDPALITVLFVYSGRTPGVEVCRNTTVILGH